MPKRTSAAESRPYRMVIVTMDSHLSSAAARASERLAREIPGACLVVHAANEWDSDPSALQRCRAPTSTRRHCDRHHVVHGGSLPPGNRVSGSTPRYLRCHDMRHVGRRGGATDSHGSILHGRQAKRRAVPAAQAAAQEIGQRYGRRRSNENAPAYSAVAAFHPGHRPGCQSLFSDPAILAGRIGRQPAPYGALFDPSASARHSPAK